MQVKIIMSWDIKPGRDQEYFEFVVREFAPGITRLGLQPTEAWFAIYGECPQIMMGGITSDFGTMKTLTFPKSADTAYKLLRSAAGERTVDLLRAAPRLRLAALFTPEHGLDGDRDEPVPSGRDARTGLPVYSLYGEQRRPTDAMLEGLEVGRTLTLVASYAGLPKERQQITIGTGTTPVTLTLQLATVQEEVFVEAEIPD